ncbi:MAG: cytotoxic translational repressor of toxin-antitoxin stability system [Deltaproteobacteria bacterium]|nr:cytotoxic translational repressor of toxin-antitoxin stability system [Deltaproteobacteria bacterium]
MWSVTFSSKARKQKAKLPKNIDDILAALVTSLILQGPAQPQWGHYGKLGGKKGEYHHCHLHSGRPTYVVVWQVLDRQVCVMAVLHVGTHESVNYDRFK